MDYLVWVCSVVLPVVLAVEGKPAILYFDELFSPVDETMCWLDGLRLKRKLRNDVPALEGYVMHGGRKLIDYTLSFDGYFIIGVISEPQLIACTEITDRYSRWKWQFVHKTCFGYARLAV